MNAVAASKDSGGLADIGGRLAFFKNLQTVTNKIHATADVDEIMLELSQEICTLFNADRLTIYSLDDDKTAIVSKIKTGLNSFKDLRLPITEQSIAGHVAMSKRIVNIRDVYDEAELKALHPELKFLREVDKRTGYRTKQMLVGPILNTANGELLGVVQIINNKDSTPFAALAEEGLKGLCETLAIAFTQRKSTHVIRSKYDYLVMDAVISVQDLEVATRKARQSGTDVEEVLITDLDVPAATIGSALSRFFNVPYEPYRGDRIKPMDLMKNIRREYVEQNHWLPVEEGPEGILILTMDPLLPATSDSAQHIRAGCSSSDPSA